jgi:hypothetical protein
VISMFIIMYILGIPNAVTIKTEKELSISYVVLWPMWSLVGLFMIAFSKKEA